MVMLVKGDFPNWLPLVFALGIVAIQVIVNFQAKLEDNSVFALLSSLMALVNNVWSWWSADIAKTIKQLIAVVSSTLILIVFSIGCTLVDGLYVGDMFALSILTLIIIYIASRIKVILSRF